MNSEQPVDRLIDLLEKALIIQLHFHGASQDDIARMLNKSKTSVNAFLRPIVKRGKP